MTRGTGRWGVPLRTSLWRSLQWSLVGALWLAALGLGYAGFAHHASAHGEVRSVWDLVYLTLQLFPLQSGAVAAPVGWKLEVARLLAPAVAAYTALQALAAIFYEQIQSLRLRITRGHVVICGLGRKGLLLTRRFLERGQQVVIIEEDEDNPFLAQCRERGALVLVGDARERAILRKARVPAAGAVVAVCEDDGANAHIVVHAAEMARGREGKALTALAQIVDPQVCWLLREREITVEGAGSFRLEFFNVFDSGARALLNEFPVAPQARGTAGGGQSHVLIVGLGRMGQSVVVHAARDWWAEHRGGDRLPITIVDREAKRKVASLRLRYPRLDDACELIAEEMDIRWPDFQRAAFLRAVVRGKSQAPGEGHERGQDHQYDVTVVYICLDNDSLGLSAALTLFQRLRWQRVPIVVRMVDDAGLATLFRGGEGNVAGFGDLHAFGLLERTCSPELLLGGTHELLARAIHEHVLAGETTSPPWEYLPEESKEAYRRQSDHIGVMLRTSGFGIVPLSDWEAESFQFTTREVEMMGRLERRRRIQEAARGRRAGRREKGAQGAETVAWERLSEEAREKERESVRRLPAFLAKAGLQVCRLQSGDLQEG